MTVTAPPLLTATDLTKRFPIRRGLLRRTVGEVRAVDGVDLALAPGTTLGLVGESGSGKSTVGRLVLRLVEPTSGRIAFDGHDLVGLPEADLRTLRRRMQMVFQDPYSSFDPTSPLADSVAEPMRTHEGTTTAAARFRLEELFARVGLAAEHLDRYPSQLSGGQLQRAAIARALAVGADLLVLDEPVSALDVSTQAQVVNLLQDLQRDLGVTYLFIAHDLSVVRHVSDRIAVMYLGTIVEEGPAESVYTAPRHPYTEALLAAVPDPNPLRQRARERVVLRGDLPSPTAPPAGCRFRTRCRYAMDVCATEPPVAFVTDDGVTTYCHLHTTGPVLQGAPVGRQREP
ncbi:ABC transporter ATP-binding protein [Pseudonocardia lutea]|uniref:ABC transporter ATP-binding protein n=1 Tax=Pseudonocardia lutea TaxID=2172015 RepID=A0ABW1ID94_9PSEU